MNEWTLKPTWFSRNIQDIKKPILDDESLKIWEQAIKVTTGDVMIVNHVNGVGPQSMIAMARYKYLKRLAERYNKWPFLLILLAECHYLMNDVYGAYTRMIQVQALIGSGTDSVLDNAVDMLFRLTEDGSTLEPTTKDIKVIDYKRPKLLNGDYQKDIDSIQAVWNQFKEKVTESKAWSCLVGMLQSLQMSSKESFNSLAILCQN